jgi:hypothetical protein
MMFLCFDVVCVLRGLLDLLVALGGFLGAELAGHCESMGWGTDSISLLFLWIVYELDCA